MEANKMKEVLATESLKEAVGGLIITTVYQCPICGAMEEKVTDTDSHDLPKGGDGWCDKCNVQMTKVKIRF